MFPEPAFPPAPALTARGRATRERIVAAAAALIHQKGVAGTSLDDVRAVTGVSKSQLYHYFRDKSALVRAVVAQQVHQVMEVQGCEFDSLEALRRWRDRVVASNRQADCARGCPLGRLASELAESDIDAREDLAAGFATWQNRIAAGLSAMRERGELPSDSDPSALALAVLAAVQGGLLLAQTMRSITPLEIALDHALDGIAALTRP